MPGPIGSYWNLAFSPDGRTLAAASYGDGCVRIWEVATGKPLHTLREHHQHVFGLAFHPDGKLLASGASDGVVRLLETSSGKLLLTLRHPHASNERKNLVVAFSPNGKLLASGSESSVRVWELSQEGKLSARERWSVPKQAHGLLTFSADGRTLFAASHGPSRDPAAPSALRRWDAATGQQQQDMPLPVLKPWSYCKLSPDGKTVALYLSGERLVRLLDVPTGKPRFPEPAFSGAVHCLRFSPDGQRLASGSTDGTGVIWDLASRKPLHVLRGHTGSVWSLAWGPDGRTLATACEDQTARIWDAATGRLLRTLAGHRGSVEDLAFSPDGRWLATASLDGTARLWDPATGQEIGECWARSGPIHGVTFSPSGLSLVTWDEGTNLRYWNLVAGKERAVHPGFKAGGKLAYYPDGRTVRTLGGRRGQTGKAALHPGGELFAAGDWRGSVRLDERQNPVRHQSWQLFPSGHPVADVAFSPEGRYLATANPDGTIGLLRLADPGQLIQLPVSPTLVQVRSLQGHGQAVRSVALSGDGRRALSSGFDNTLRLWDVTAGKELRRFPGERNLSRGLAFSPDGQRALSSIGDNGLFRLWDVEEAKAIRSFDGHVAICACVAFSPDGKWGLSGSGHASVRLWDLETGKEQRRFVGHTNAIRSVTFSPDGRQALSCSADRTVRLWDVQSGKQVCLFAGHVGDVWSVAFSRDGRRLVSGGADGTVRLWDVATGQEQRCLMARGSINGVAALPDGRVVSAGSDSVLRLWDAESGKELDHRVGHQGGILSLAVSRDGGQILTGGRDGAVRLWRIVDPQPGASGN